MRKFDEENQNFNIYDNIRTASTLSSRSSSSSLPTITYDEFIGEMDEGFGIDICKKRQCLDRVEVLEKRKSQNGETHILDFSSRQMTYPQEIMNAFTMVPGPLYCIYLVLSGKWLTKHFIEIAGVKCQMDPNFQLRNNNSSMRILSMIPRPMLAIMLGVCIHFPFSFYYHWLCAKHIPKGNRRITHISRRLDQAFIHVAATFYSYGTSGSWKYFLFCALFNTDSACRQFESKVSGCICCGHPM